MPSKRSSVSGCESGERNAWRLNCAGRAMPVASTCTVGSTSSVMLRWLRLVDGVYSCTFAVTLTRSPTFTVGAVLVNTKTPSDVFGSASTFASSTCRKKPLLNFFAVTTPCTSTRWPTTGEARPLPCTSWIDIGVAGSGGGGGALPLLRGSARRPWKSAVLSLVSVAPPFLRWSEPAAATVGAVPVPSKQLVEP